MNGLGFKDLILNYPSLFEVVIPDDIDSPVLGVSDENEKEVFDLVSPDEESPIVCVIDSGVQEGHRWLSAAILPGLSRCFVPQCGDNDIADYVPDGGHGTRVAGAVLYPNQVPKTGTAQAPFWITNARVLDKDCRLKESVFPPELFRTVVNYFSSKGVRIFNHSVAANCACRTNRMSAWATSIDDLSFSKDALVIQAAGNLRERSGVANQPGILDHLEAGRPYPRYLYDPSSRIANPAQSLQALTVGSIAGNFRG
jgi:subtilisin family serine protease